MRIQDSLFYQDFSYQIKTDISINNWRSILKNTIHPAGWNVFGAILIDSIVSGTSITTPIKLERGIFKSSYIPILLTKVFGRSLGTKTQGILNTEPNLGVISDTRLRNIKIVTEDGYFNILLEGDNSSDNIIFELYNREVTLTSEVIIYPYKNAQKHGRRYNPIFNIQKFGNFITESVVDGVPVHPSGSWAQNNYSREIVAGEYYTINQLSDYTIEELPASSKYTDYNPTPEDVLSRRTTNIPPPGELYLVTPN